MWPFGRKAQTAAPGRPQPLPAPVIRRDWAALPPIQRSFGEHPLTAPSDRFSDDLVTHHDPSVSSNQMGHQVSAEAPPGLVLALVRPTTRSDGPAMIPRPRVQRRAAGAVAESGEWDGDEAAPIEARSSPLPTSTQRVAIIERPVVTPVADQPLLTALAPDAHPVPVMSKPRRTLAPMSFDMPPNGANDSADPPVGQPAPRLTLGQARRLGLGAAINKVPDRSVQRSRIEPAGLSGTPAPVPLRPSVGDAMSPSPTSDQAAPTAAGTVRPTAIESSSPSISRSAADARSLPLAPMHPTTDSLGEPMLAHADESAVMSPVLPESSAAVSSLGSASSARPSAAPQASDPASQPEPRVNTTSPAGSPETPLDFGVRGARAMPLRPQPFTGVPSGRPATAATATAALAVAPLVGMRPIATLQRSPENAAPAADRRGTAGVTDEGGNRGGDLAFIDDDEPADKEPMSVASDLGPRASPPTIQRLVADTVDDGRAPTLTLPPRPPGPLADWADERPARRETAGVNFPLAPAPVIVQRIAADESSSRTAWATLTAEPSLQREPTEAPAVGESPGAAWAGPGGATSPNGSAFHPAADSPAAEPDMDALAAKLYDRIRLRIKTELLVDRERAGLLTDLR